MRNLVLVFMCLVCGTSLFAAVIQAVAPDSAGQDVPDASDPLKTIIERHLGRPYVWGGSGLKSFDCSGFVWRVMFENGILMKRTTARKLYFCLSRVPESKKWTFGNIVFFDDLKHCGIVAGPDTFYQSETSIGTNLSQFDPFWRPKICGVRAVKPVTSGDAKRLPAQ
jgi:cell wall-associated NlpC family hydrolase